MKQNKKLWGVLCSFLLMASLGACSSDTEPSSSSNGSSSGTQVEQPSQSTQDTSEDEQEEITLGQRGDVLVNLVMLTGPTGMGAASLIAKNLEEETLNPYEVTMLPANDQAVAMLTSGEADIAALSTSVAATLYNKTNDISVLAVNTLGVLYLLEKGGDNLKNMEDLKGETIWATGQGSNPEYILDKLLVEAGLNPETDVTVEWMTAEEVSAKMISSDTGVCMLPVPASTALLMKEESIVEAVDMGAEWSRLVKSGLPMGCVVVRNGFLEEHPEAVEAFLLDYEASLEIMQDEAQYSDSAEWVVEAGISPSVEIATEALPKAALVYSTGNDMKTMLQSYFVIMFQANKDSIGGGLPYDDFYYGVS